MSDDRRPDVLIHMAVPPSLNKLWITVPGRPRARSQAYRAWAESAGWDVKRQIIGMPMVECRFDMEIKVPISGRDTGNWEKAIGDLLESVGVVSNDGNVNDLTVRPMERTDCSVALFLRPDLGHVRAAAPPKGFRPARRNGQPRYLVSKQLRLRMNAFGLG